MDSNQDQLKKEAAIAAAREVRDGMVVGLGTGSTADKATEYLGQQNLRITAIPTSQATEKLARALGIDIIPLVEVESIDILIDGADECTSNGHLIKGGGGALLREKIVASISQRKLYVVDDSKLVDELGRFPLPVEVSCFGWEIVSKKLQTLGYTTNLRRQESKIFKTDNHNYILDCSGVMISDPFDMSNKIRSIVGVVEHGIFEGYATEIFAAGKEGLRHWKFD